MDWEISEKQHHFTIPYSKEEELVIIPDAEFWIPGIVEDNKNADQLLLQLKYANSVMARYRALSMINPASMKTDDLILILESGLIDKSSFIRTSTLDYFYTKDGSNYINDFKNLVGAIAANDPDNNVKSEALYLLGKIKVQNFSTVYEIAVLDSSYKVATAGLYALEQINHNKATELARNLLQQNINSALFTSMAAKIIAIDADIRDFSFFENTIWQYYEGNRSSFLIAFYSYLNNLRDATVYKKGIDVLVQLIDTDVTSNKHVVSPIFLYYAYQTASNKFQANKGYSVASVYKEQQDYALSAYKKVKATLKDQALLASLNNLEKAKE